MTKEQALKILADACAQFKGNLSDHQTIQQALTVVSDLLSEKSDEKAKAK